MSEHLPPLDKSRSFPHLALVVVLGYATKNTGALRGVQSYLERGSGKTARPFAGVERKLAAQRSCG